MLVAPSQNTDSVYKRPRGRPKKVVEKVGIVKPERSSGRPKGTTKHYDKTPIKTTVVFHWNRTTEAQIVLNRGGARSSKSYSIAQLLVEWFFTVPKIKILILRKTQPSLRISVIPLIWEIIDLYNLRSKVIEVRQDRNLWSPSKGMIHFGGLDDPEKIKSTDWNVIWIEEGTEFVYDDFINLKLRLSTPAPVSWFRNKMFISFNPVDEFHFLKTKILDQHSEDAIDIHSTYQYNPFLSKDYIRTIEAIKFQDKNYWSIFGLGEWGKLEHIIYSNWSSVQLL